MELSERRAMAVYDYLVRNGIDPNSLSYKGYGETTPISTDKDEESRKLNRRIEFVIIE